MSITVIVALIFLFKKDALKSNLKNNLNAEQ